MGKVKIGDAIIAYEAEDGREWGAIALNNNRLKQIGKEVADIGLPMTEGREVKRNSLESRADLAAAFLLDIVGLSPDTVRNARHVLEDNKIELSDFVGEDGKPLVEEQADFDVYICKTASAVARRMVGREFVSVRDMKDPVKGAAFYRLGDGSYLPAEMEQQQPGLEPKKPGLFKQIFHKISDRLFADDFKKYDQEKSAFDIRQKAWNAGTDYQNRLKNGKKTLAKATGVDPNTLRKREPAVIEGINKRSEVSKTVTPKTPEYSKEHTFSK